ncbi:MAG: FMN-dependent alpha-hydroxy acid dehydrogenase [Gemmatimonadetes bacterium]|nr:FMN-dependent alpha-hydroxy acid dehydrogenase [Gemmatimonadota bacterium]
MTATSDIGRERQRAVYLGGVAGRKPLVPVDLSRLEAAARKAMTAEAFAYVAGGAGAESTMAANRAAFERWRIVPRVLRDVEVRDTSVELFGRRLPAPLLLAPIGVLEMAHAQADLAVARAAASLGVPMVFSNQGSVPMEACAAAMGGSPRWFQLYWSRDDALVRSLVRRAEACGCEAIVLTLDTTMLGWRARDLDLAYLPFLRGRGIAQYTSDPVFLASLDDPLPGAPAGAARVNLHSLRALAQMVRRHPGRFAANLRSGVARKAVQRFVATYSRPSLTWDDLSFLRGLTTLPIVLKGIQHPDDAHMAVERGMDGVVVSNHGGRQVDGAIGSLDALPAVVDAVGGRVPVLFDSGVRGGADVFKALALGATAVCLGRPYVYGLALAGEAGVREVVQNVLAELDLTLGLAGCRSVAEAGAQAVVRV